MKLCGYDIDVITQIPETCCTYPHHGSPKQVSPKEAFPTKVEKCQTRNKDTCKVWNVATKHLRECQVVIDCNYKHLTQRDQDKVHLGTKNSQHETVASNSYQIWITNISTKGFEQTVNWNVTLPSCVAYNIQLGS